MIVERSLENEFQDIKEKVWRAYMEGNKQLKPCPFCGDTPTITVRQITDEDDCAWWRATITCDNCGCTFKDDHTYENAIEAELYSSRLVERWNNRIKLKDE